MFGMLPFARSDLVAHAERVVPIHQFLHVLFLAHQGSETKSAPTSDQMFDQDPLQFLQFLPLTSDPRNGPPAGTEDGLLDRDLPGPPGRHSLSSSVPASSRARFARRARATGRDGGSGGRGNVGHPLWV